MSCPNTIPCACPHTNCPRHGKCCECIKAHSSNDQVPFCLYPDNQGDKSLQSFYLNLKKRFEG